MRSLLGLLAAFMLVMSIGMGSVVHASEPLGCEDAAVASAMTHADCGMMKVPADGDKGYPHHHGACHDHQVAAPADAAASALPTVAAAMPAAARVQRLSGGEVEIAQEPPRA